MACVKLGDRVKIQGKTSKGEVAFIGETDFSDGMWIGIILDDEKGKHDGIVFGKRYFNCPRNRGIFVRACQVEKECSENAEDNGNNVARTAYPNYLKASSKLKSNKHVCGSKNDAPDTEMENKDVKDQANETDSSEINVNISEFEAIKDENKTLKDELKAKEKSVQKTQDKCKKALGEIEQLKKDLESRKKQIKVQKCNIKLLKMRQCKHYKKAECFVTPYKKPKVSKNGGALTAEVNLDDEDLNVSDDEFDFECLKSLASMQRLVELEDQNRIMVQGLVELREFLKSISHSQVWDFEIPHSKSIHCKTVDSAYPHFFSSLINSSATVRGNDILSDEASALHLKEYNEMLREMTEFTQYVKERNKMEKEVGVQKRRNFDQIGDFIRIQNESTSGDETFQNLYQPPNRAQSNKSCFDSSGIQFESTGFQNTDCTGSNNFTDHFQTVRNGNSHKLYDFYAVQDNYEDPVNDFTQPTSSMGANSKIHIWPSETSLVQQNTLGAFKTTLKSIKGTVEIQPEFPLSHPKMRWK